MKILSDVLLQTEVYSVYEQKNEWEESVYYWEPIIIDLTNWMLVGRASLDDTGENMATAIECQNLRNIIINENYKEMFKLFIKFKETGSLAT